MITKYYRLPGQLAGGGNKGGGGKGSGPGRGKGGGSGGGSSNPTLANVALIIHGDERPFLDVSSVQRLVANYRGQLTVSGGKISVGSNSDRLKVPNVGGAFNFGTGAFCVAAKVTRTATGARIFDTRNNSGAPTNGWVAAVSASGVPFMGFIGTNYGDGTPLSSITLSVGVEYEVMFTYDGTTLRCFVDGATAWTHVVALNNSDGADLNICNTAEGATNAHVGQLTRELIVVKGEAFKTAPYTPIARWADSGATLAAPSAPSAGNLKLMVHGNGADASTVINDSSPAARTGTVVGNAQIDTAQSRFGGASILMDGSGDKVTYPNSVDFDLPGDFSAGFQIRPVTNLTTANIISTYQNTTNGWSIFFNGAAGRMVMNLTGDGIDIRTQDGAFTSGVWREGVFARTGAIVAAFVEITATGFGGVQALEAVDFISDSTSLTSTQVLTIGALSGFTGDFNGHMEELRVIKGQNVYPRSVLAQTAAHPDT